MALIRTMGQLIGLCQRRADKEPDPHVDTDEWKELISEVYGELHGAVSEVGSRYFEAEATINATGASSYALPADHLSSIGVDRVDAGGRRFELDQLMVQERNAFAGTTGDARCWTFSGTNIVLWPTPASGTYKHLYVPQPEDLTSKGNSSEVDVVNAYGLKFLTWGVASIALHKGADDQIRAVAERNQALEKVREWAVLRALNMPRRRIVRDVDVYGGAWSDADRRLTPP